MSDTDMNDLLIELGTEELPPKALSKLSAAFSGGIVDGLKKAGFEFGEVESFAAPRRLAVLIRSIAASQPDRKVERKGPNLKAAYDADGNPTEGIAYKNTGILFGVGFDPSVLPFLPDMAFDFAIGARMKYVSAQIAEEAGSGFSFDLGFRTTIPDMNLGPLSVTDMAFGFTAVNLFGGVNYDAVTDDFLMDLRLGASARLAETFFLAFDLHLGGSAQLGLVYSPVPTLDLRVGMISRGTVSLTAGVGVNVEGFLIDYAFVSHKLGGTHRVSLTLDFSSLDIAAMSRSLRNILP